MAWLNWLLKLHVRLRTISLLISTHITYVYVQQMLYSFVWLYLIKCVFIGSIFVDQTQKDFWVFQLFLESILFLQKIVKIFKNSVALFWRLYHGLVQSHAPVTSPHIDFSRLTRGSMSQSQKILRIFFKIFVLSVDNLEIWGLNLFSPYSYLWEDFLVLWEAVRKGPIHIGWSYGL